MVQKRPHSACLVLGLPLTHHSSSDVAQEIISNVQKCQYGYVCAANVHMVATAKANARFKEVLNAASIVIPDGLPLVWVSKFMGFESSQRISGPDLTLKVCEMAERAGISVSFYGGSKKTIDGLRSFIRARFPHLNVAGLESPPMLPERPDANSDVVARVKASGAGIVFVGLGCPKQEFWMAAYSPLLPAVLIGVGAAFDFLAGTVKRAPAWMQNNGLEWFYRFLQEPRRLWKRYLITNTLFAFMVLEEILKGRCQQSRK